MNPALVHKLVNIRPKIRSLLHHHRTHDPSGSRRFGSTASSKQISKDYAEWERYDGPIVISGISGRFPSACNNKELIQKLLNGEELTSPTGTRYPNELLPERFGFLNCLDKFDAGFFSLTPRQAHQLDPQMRLLLEAAFEAMIDAGMSPGDMRGSRTGVFSGAYGGEALDYNSFRHSGDNDGYQGLCSMSFMIPARLAFAFDFQGPSSHVSTACSSSLTALEIAVQSMRLGSCDAALVTGSTVHLNPQTHLDLVAFGALAKDGRSKAFDQAADGFARAEAAVAMLIQKEKDAKRNYAKILNIRSRTDGFKHEGLMYPSTQSQEKLLKETYAQVGLDPAHVSYLEAHGTGTASGDPEELQAAHNTFCKGGEKVRSKPLLIGSVKTNLGHTEAAAGMCSIAKVIGTIQTGIIPKNLWFTKPKAEEEHLFDGSMMVVTEPSPFDGGIIGISSVGIGGTSYHLILEPGPTNQKPSLQQQQEHQLPILIPFSGRSAAQVEESIKEAAESARNPEFTYLLHNAFQRDISGHCYRGFGLLKPGATEPTVTVENCDSSRRRPVWIIFPGLGSQWKDMGKDLMQVAPFAESVHRSRATLKNLNMDLKELVTQKTFNDIHYMVVATTVMQMALYDTIKELGLIPDGLIGHSTGETLCAYADGCFTAEETLLVSDARGRAFKQAQKIEGGMASVGLSWEEVKVRLPADLELACHNAAQNVTVSGPLDSVEKFVDELKKEGKFVARVNSCGMAAHSRHVEGAADLLKKYAADIIEQSRPRSSRWISTSIPKANWDAPWSKSASPEYFANNLRAPVLFYEALQHVPPRALVVEVSPKGFFQALLKESVPNDCVHVAPMTFKAEDKLEHFFQAVGQMYASGVDVQVQKLYPAVTTPVSASTPSLAHLVKWNHETSWKTSILTYPIEMGAEAIIDLESSNYAAVKGHKIDNRVLLPAAAYLHCVWQLYAFQLGLNYENEPIAFTNVTFRRATVLQESHPTTVFCEVNSSSGKFQFQNEGDIVATGTIARLPKGTCSFSGQPPQNLPSKYLALDKADFYKELQLRGYNYTGAYQSVRNIDNQGQWADVEWIGDWSALLDGLLQTTILSTTSRSLMVSMGLDELTIDPIEFRKHLRDPPEGVEHPLVRVITLPNQRKVVTAGIQIKGIQSNVFPRKGQLGNLAYENFTFCPYVEKSTEDVETHVWEMVDLVLDNSRQSNKLEFVDVFTNKENSLAKLYQDILLLKPMRESQVSMLTPTTEANKMEEKEKEVAKLVSKGTKEELVPDVPADFVFLDDVTLLESIIPSLKPAGFLLLQSQGLAEAPMTPPADLELICQKSLAFKSMSLYRKVPSGLLDRIVHVAVDSESFAWVEQLQDALRKPGAEASRIYITSQGNPSSGILGLVSCLRKEDGGERIRCIFDPEGSLELNFVSPNEQLQTVLKQDLGTVVIRNGQLGSYRNIPFKAGTRKGSLQPVEHAYVHPRVPGDLSSLGWVESGLKNYIQRPPSAPNKQPSETLVEVAYAAMNFRDVLLATATIPLQLEFSYKEAYLGFEFSGWDDAGARVMGITQERGLATSVACDPRFLWKVPDDWSLEQAATVPIVYSTVLYAFHTRGRIKPGQTVLIHAGSGGVGQAAISVALAHGCTVLTTVGTPEKREFIKSLYPQLKDEQIGNSRDLSFEAQFMEVTNGRGVDVVLNSLAGDKLHATLRCLAVNGKFLEIGIFDAFMNTRLGMRPFVNNIEFHGITLYNVMGDDLDSGEEMRRQLDDSIKSGAIKPLHSHVFQKDQVEDAFRFMATGKHMGKLLLKIRDEASSREEPLNLPAARRSYFESDKTYIIVGGLGGLGLEVAGWLVERGARHLVLVSRSGLTTGYQSLCLRKWEQLGITVETPAVDLSEKKVAESFLFELIIAKNCKLGGIFNSAIVLRDESFPKQTVEAFHQVCAPKATITQILDELTRNYCPDLDYFVVFSSGACGRGNPYQTNYGWANAVMERICERRMADGLHGLAIQWGVIGQVGVMAEKILKTMDETTELMGTLAQNVDSCLEVLDAALLQKSSPIVSSMVVAEKGNKTLDKVGLLARMQKIFGIKDIDSVSADKKLSELGMDSLIAVELRQALERQYDMPIAKELLLSLTIADIKAMDAGTFDPSARPQVGREFGIKPAVVVDSVPFKVHQECLVQLNSKPGGSALFVIHGLDGGMEIFLPLASQLNMAVHGLQFTSKYDPTSVRSMAEGYIKEIKGAQGVGPYNIAGYSGGTTIAYEMAQQLQQGGDEVGTLILLDGRPSYKGTGEQVKKSIFLHLLESQNLYTQLTEDEREQLDSSITGNVETDVNVMIKLGEKLGVVTLDPENVTNYVSLTKGIIEYEPEHKYDGKLVLIEASDASEFSLGVTPENDNVLEYCIGHISFHKVGGHHRSFLKEDKVQETAGIINGLFVSKEDPNNER